MEEKHKILIVDDEKSFREFLEILFENENFEVFLARSTSEALEILKNNPINIAIIDLMLGTSNGLEIPKKALELGIKIPFILMTAYANTETALESVKLGVVDYITKPFDTDNLITMIKKVLDIKIPDKNCYEQLKCIVGKSPEISKLKSEITDIASGDSSVLITGESGTGKELVAKAIHNLSKRKNRPFVAINCGAIPSELLESELFGYKKGAFTGAVSDKKGLFESASHGIVFLDEIGDMPLFLQVKLLRVLQERTIMPVGSNQTVNIDVRIISASNKDINSETESGRFRKDLFYRLNVVNINVPSLNERQGDIEVLAKFFLNRYANIAEKNINEISFSAMEMLKNYSFPGNVRELENIIERGVLIEKSEKLLPSSLPDFLISRKTKAKTASDDIKLPTNLDKIVENIEIKYIKKALELAENNQSRAAKFLGLSLRIFRYKMEKYDVK